MRTPVSFTVQLLLAAEKEGDPPVTKWLQEDGEAGPEASAVRFTFASSSTPVERERIDRLSHEYAGGLHEYLDLVRGCESTRIVVLQQIESHCWPKGRPAVDGKELEEQQKQIEAVWPTWDSIEKDGYASMRGMLDRLLFMATWRVLIRTPPAGWESIADRDLDTGVFYILWNTWLKATEAARAGK